MYTVILIYDKEANKPSLLQPIFFNSTLKVNWLRINFYLVEGFNSELINAFNGVIAADELAAKRSG